jgi:hypothetical protein
MLFDIVKKEYPDAVIGKWVEDDDLKDTEFNKKYRGKLGIFKPDGNLIFGAFDSEEELLNEAVKFLEFRKTIPKEWVARLVARIQDTEKEIDNE